VALESAQNSCERENGSGIFGEMRVPLSVDPLTGQAECPPEPRESQPARNDYLRSALPGCRTAPSRQSVRLQSLSGRAANSRKASALKFSGVREYLDSRVVANSFEPLGRDIADSDAGHSIEPFPAQTASVVTIKAPDRTRQFYHRSASRWYR